MAEVVAPAGVIRFDAHLGARQAEIVAAVPCQPVGLTRRIQRGCSRQWLRTVTVTATGAGRQQRDAVRPDPAAPTVQG